MGNWLKRKWAQVKIKWQKFVAWLLGVLASIGIIFGVALADDVSLSWTNATQWEDGTALDVADLEATILYKQSFPLDGAGMSDPRSYTELDRVVPTITSYVDANQANGVHCYVATHLAKNGEESAQSNESCKTVDVRRPGSPGNLSAN